jgi:hypothetical protein
MALRPLSPQTRRLGRLERAHRNCRSPAKGGRGRAFASSCSGSGNSVSLTYSGRLGAPPRQRSKPPIARRRTGDASKLASRAEHAARNTRTKPTDSDGLLASGGFWETPAAPRARLRARSVTCALSQICCRRARPSDACPHERAVRAVERRGLQPRRKSLSGP